jgi:hypothetical protein
MRNVWDKICGENQNTFYIQSGFSENSVQRDRRQLTTWRTRIACWIPKAKEAHSEYVISIAFQLQQWLYQRALMLHDTLPGLFRCKSIKFVRYKDPNISEEKTTASILSAQNPLTGNTKWYRKARNETREAKTLTSVCDVKLPCLRLKHRLMSWYNLITTPKRCTNFSNLFLE